MPALGPPVPLQLFPALVQRPSGIFSGALNEIAKLVVELVDAVQIRRDRPHDLLHRQGPVETDGVPAVPLTSPAAHQVSADAICRAFRTARSGEPAMGTGSPCETGGEARLLTEQRGDKSRRQKEDGGSDEGEEKSNGHEHSVRRALKERKEINLTCRPE